MHKRLLSLLGAAYSKVHLFGHLEMTSLEDAFQRARRMPFLDLKGRKDHTDPQGTKQAQNFAQTGQWGGLFKAALLCYRPEPTHP